MATMGKYCQAYSLKKLREFSQWTECTENTKSTRRENKSVEGKEVESNRELSDDDFLYLQENYLVTDGILKDEEIIFDNITPEWKEFCHKTLAFEILVYETVLVQTSTNQNKSDS